MREIKITETVLRDAQQSLIATRMPRSDFEDILETMDKAGYYSLECWGGATFDSCLRYLDEDPWERLRFIRSKVKNTKLQMLLRGQNLLGYHHYSDDTVRSFVRKSVENGIDIIRIFDALNDYTNIKTAVDECIKAGGHAQGTICYTTSPIHTLEKMVELAKELEDMGCHSICLKDMAGIMTPQIAFDLVSAVKKVVNIPVVLHTHATTGMSQMTYLKAVEAGVDVIDTAISNMSGGTSQPATESTVFALKEMGYEINVDTKLLKVINDHFADVKKKFLDNGILNPVVMGTSVDGLHYQVPGGMLSNLVAQLTAQNAMDKFEECLIETPKVRADLGYPPLVTPMSQMVGVQAVQNVLLGRYKNIGKEVKAYCRGEYGKAPGEISEELMELALKGEPRIQGRYAETLEDEMAKAKAELEEIADGRYAKTEENVLSYTLFPQIAKKFFESLEEKRMNKISFNYTIRKVD